MLSIQEHDKHVNPSNFGQAFQNIANLIVGFIPNTTHVSMLLQGYPIGRHTLYNASPKDQSFAQIDQTRVTTGKGIHSSKEERTRIE